MSSGGGTLEKSTSDLHLATKDQIQRLPLNPQFVRKLYPQVALALQQLHLKTLQPGHRYPI